MNRTSAKRGFKALFAMFLLVGGLMFVSNNVNAQSAPPKLDLSGILWMTEAEALDVLSANIAATHQQLGVAVPGSPAFNAGMRRAVFLKSIHAEVSTGVSVPDALLHTYDQHDNDGIYAEKPQIAFTLAQANVEADYAIAILRVN